MIETVPCGRGAADRNEIGVGKLPTGTVTLLVADNEGSTRLWDTQPEEMAAASTGLDGMLTGLVAAHQGVFAAVPGSGDGFMLAFASATEAVACAVQLQLQLQRESPVPIRLRVAVHTGEIQLGEQSNYVGPQVDRVVRLRDLAHYGQTVLSSITEALVIDALPADVWLMDLGSYQLRGVARPERVSQLCHPGIRNDFPPLGPSKPVAVEHLPVPLTSFVGRREEIDGVRRALAGNRLVTLTGAGGAGKTRLAIQVAGHLAADFDDGVRYVDLVSTTDPTLVPATMAAALGLGDQPSPSTTQRLIRVLADRQVLVLLDNCEHLLAAIAELVAALLSACPGLTLLATSREPIGVAGEATWQVPPLSLDDEAVELFVDRARRVRSGFMASADDVEDVKEICRRLDGMPLAIELAAARVRALTLHEIVNSLHDRFRLLTGGSRTSVRRQQTLHASVDWSHALLTEPEQVLFRRLAVFRNGFDLDAAQSIACGTEIERYQALDQLALLVDKSLVVADDAGGRTRYHLLETVRHYAVMKLGESGEADTVRSRHRDHYTAVAAQLDAPAVSGHQRRVEHAEAEIDNLRAAFTWSRDSGDVEPALQLASALQPLWLTRGRLREGLSWIDLALADLRAADREVAPAVVARALADAALLDGWVGVPERREQAGEALVIARQLDDPPLLVRALTACCGTAVFAPEQAAAYFAEAIDLARGLGDKWRLSQLLGFQAYGLVMAGDPSAARAVGDEGRELAEAIGDRFAAGLCRVWGVAGARAILGDLPGSETELVEVIADADAAGDPLCRCNGLITYSFMLGWQGKMAEALAAAEAAIESALELGVHIEGQSYLALAGAHLAAGDVSAAQIALAEGWRRITNIDFAIMNMRWRSETELAAGDVAGARSWADQAVAATTGCFRMMSLTTRARVALAEDDAGAAERDAYDALACAVESKARLVLPDAFECLAYAAARAHNYTHAARLHGAAQGIRDRTGEVRYRIHQSGYEDSVASLRDAMGQHDFGVAWADGAALSTDEAIAYAQRGRGERNRPSTGWDSLTPTERDVIRLVSEGLSNKDIATRLCVSPRTVETHLTHVYTKLGLSSRVRLAQEATRRG